jgi:spore coat protein U-like protein
MYPAGGHQAIFRGFARHGVAAGLLAAAQGSGYAATIPTMPTFTVGATVVSGCFVSGSPAATTNLVFGLLDFGVHPALTAGTQSVTAGAVGGSQAMLQCTPGTTVQVSVDAGLHANGTQRRLATGSGAFAAYAVFLSTAPTVPLLPGVPASLVLGSTATALPLRGTVTYPGPGSPAGVYADTVQVTVSW